MNTAIDHGQVIAPDRIVEITDNNRGYNEPLLRRMRAALEEPTLQQLIAGFPMRDFGSDAEVEKTILRPLLTGLDSQSGFNRFGPVARVEFVSYHDDELGTYVCGAGVFDSASRPLFFSRNARLGQVDERVLFSRWLMARLGAPEDFFDEVNGAVGAQYDTVVMSRELCADFVGSGYLPVRKYWEWWIA